MPKNNRANTEEENFTIHCIQDGKKGGRKKPETFQESLLSTAMIQKRLVKSIWLLNDLKNHGNQILILSDKRTLTVDPVFNKQNYRVVTFGNDVSEHSRVSTIKHPVSIMMLGVVLSNGEKMPLVRFERGYRLTSAFTKKFCWRKFFPGSKRSLIHQITFSNRRKRWYTRQRLCSICWTPTWTFGSKILSSIVARFKPSRLQLMNAVLEKSLQNTPQQHRWVQDFCEQRMAVDEEKLHQDGLQKPSTLITAYYCRQNGHME